MDKKQISSMENQSENPRKKLHKNQAWTSSGKMPKLINLFGGLYGDRSRASLGCETGHQSKHEKCHSIHKKRGGKKSTADAPMKNNMRQARMVLKTISEEQKKVERKSWSDMKRPH